MTNEYGLYNTCTHIPCILYQKDKCFLQSYYSSHTRTITFRFLAIFLPSTIHRDFYLTAFPDEKQPTFTISLAALIMFLMEWVLSCSNLLLTTMTSKLLDKGYSMNPNFKRIWMMMIIIVISGQSKLYHYSSFSTVLCVA